MRMTIQSSSMSNFIAPSNLHPAASALITWATQIEKRAAVVQRTDPQEAKEDFAEAKSARDLAARIAQEQSVVNKIRNELADAQKRLDAQASQAKQITAWES